MDFPVNFYTMSFNEQANFLSAFYASLVTSGDVGYVDIESNWWGIEAEIEGEDFSFDANGFDTLLAVGEDVMGTLENISRAYVYANKADLTLYDGVDYLRVNAENVDIANQAWSGNPWVSLRGVETITYTSNWFANDDVYGRVNDSGFFNLGYGDDQLDVYGNGNNFVFAGSGDDRVETGDGGDLVLGGSGKDEIEGNGGNDSLFGNSGDDTVEGGSGDDVISGGSGDDSLEGDSGDDTVYGGSGNDTVEGGSGNDLLFGGSGEDVFIFKGNDGDQKSIVGDFEEGESISLEDLAGVNNIEITKGHDGQLIVDIETQDTSNDLPWWFDNFLDAA